MRLNRPQARVLCVVAAAAVLMAAPRGGGSAAWADESAHLDAAAAERESRPLGAPRTDAVRPGVGAGRAEGGGSILSSPAARTGGSLAVVLGLIFGLARLAKKLSGSGVLGGSLGAGARAPAGILEVLGRYPVGRGQTLMLLRMDSRILLLSQSSPAGLRVRGGGAGTMSLIAEVTDPQEVASILVKVQDAEQAQANARFGDLLGRFETGMGEGTDGVVEVPSGRRAVRSRSGDRAELWDVEPAPAGLAGSLKGRLSALRSGVVGGGR